MWRELTKHLPEFPTAVLTGVDSEGYPYSVRCRARAEEGAGRIRLDLRGEHPLVEGPASLLCHSLNEQLWDLRNLLVRGVLARDGAGWVLRPVKFVPGAGIGSILKTFMEGRRVAAAYLAKRGMSRPVIPWDRIRGAKQAAAAKADKLR